MCKTVQNLGIMYHEWAQKRSPNPLLRKGLLCEGDGNRTRNHRIDRKPAETQKNPYFPEVFCYFTPFDRFCKPS